VFNNRYTEEQNLNKTNKKLSYPPEDKPKKSYNLSHDKFIVNLEDKNFKGLDVKNFSMTVLSFWRID
jgi:hypothetical protein